MTFGPGAVIGGRYHADRLVGAGGMGEVWAGELLANVLPESGRGPTVAGQKVALKRLLPAASQHHEVVARFRREAVLLGRIQSNYVARVYDFVDDPTFGPVLVMEFIEGPSLAHVLEDRKLEVEEAVDLAVDLALALCDLHDAKIVHRDLKPGNIIMRPQRDGTTHAVIVDFGIGRQLATADAPDEITGITKANIALGTVEYMAPEQILNSREVTPLTDIYAIGAILFRAVAGVHAFGARRGEVLARAKLIEDSPKLETGRDDEVAREVVEIVARCLKKRPAQRFASARDLHSAVKRLQDRVRIEALDLDSTTADGSRTRIVDEVREASPLPAAAQAPVAPSRPERTDRVPVFQQVSPPSPSNREVRVASPPDVRSADPRASQADLRRSLSGVQASPQPVPSVRGPMPSVPDGRGSMPSISDGHASLPSIQTSGPMSGPAPSSGSGAAAAAGRAPFASIPDMGYPARSVAEPQPRSGVSGMTVTLAVLTAFAVGGATGVVLAPKLTEDKGLTGASANASPGASQATCPACSSASQSSAIASTTESAMVAPSASGLAVGSPSGAPSASAALSVEASSAAAAHAPALPLSGGPGVDAPPPTAAAPVAPPSTAQAQPQAPSPPAAPRPPSPL